MHASNSTDLVSNFIMDLEDHHRDSMDLVAHLMDHLVLKAMDHVGTDREDRDSTDREDHHLNGSGVPEVLILTAHATDDLMGLVALPVLHLALRRVHHVAHPLPTPVPHWTRISKTNRSVRNPILCSINSKLNMGRWTNIRTVIISMNNPMKRTNHLPVMTLTNILKWTDHHPVIRTSVDPQVRTSADPQVRTSMGPQVPTSTDPQVPTSTANLVGSSSGPQDLREAVDSDPQ